MANKIVSLRLTGLTYGGESIGKDLTIEIEAADRMLSLNKEVSVGQSVAMKDLVGHFVVTQRSFSLSITVRVIERDLVYNDVGSTQGQLRVNLTDSAAQGFTYSVEVKEQGAILSSNVALFEVELEAQVTPTTRYVADKGDRYLHMGRASLGCMTVTERTRWDGLCAVLVRPRKGDGVSVGTVEVVD